MNLTTSQSGVRPIHNIKRKDKITSSAIPKFQIQ